MIMIPGETILNGADAVCPDCHVAPPFEVHRSAAGYYIGTYCNCGPWSRESEYFKTREEAVKALEMGPDYFAR
jgi:hypothetical protein